MKKRILAVTLTVALLIGLMIPTAFATGIPCPTLTVTASQTEAEPGDTITFTITSTAIDQLNTVEIGVEPVGMTYVEGSGSLNYDFQVTSALSGFTVNWIEPNQKFSVPQIMGFGGPVSTTGDTVLATFDCVVDEDFTGEATIELDVREFYFGSLSDLDGNDSYTTETTPIKTVTITVSVSPTGLTLSATKLSVDEGDTVTLTATVEPELADQSVTFTSSDESVATVDENGVITGVSEGTAVITVTTADGSISATCTVTVNHVHTYSTDWSSDENGHWHACTAGDGAQTDYAAHSGGSATCDTLAVCEICGASYGEYAAHTLTHVEAVAATHETDGNIEYWTCDVCGKVFSDAEGTNEITLADTVIAATGHSYSDEWSCDENSHWHECGCGNIIDLADHDYVWVTDVAAGCETEGVQHQECSVCGYVVESTIGTVIPATGHTLTHVEAVAATCSAEGNIEYWVCDVCGKVFSDAAATTEIALTDTVIAIDPENHTGETVVVGAVAATCEEDGYTGDICCADCGVVLETGSVIPATGHTLTHVEAVAATCSTEGNTEYWVCDACGKVFSDAEGTTEIAQAETVTARDPDNHTGETKVVGASEATCAATGYTGDICCADCGAVLEAGTVIPATGHHDLSYIEAVEATETTEGNIAYWYCEVCGAAFADADCTLPLDWDDIVIAALGSSTDTGDASLEDVYEEALELNEDDYTEDSWAALEEALEAAKAVLEDEDATQEEIDAALAALNAAIEALVEVSDSSTSSDTSAQTGDQSLIGLCLAVMLAAGLGLVILAVVNKRKHIER